MRLFSAGVTRTTMRGLAAPETVVAVPTSNLIMHDITMHEIAKAISEVRQSLACDGKRAG